MAQGRFEGKVVIVTGGGSGIGAATAHRFGSEGATVVITGRTRDKLDEVVADAPAGATLVGRVADTSDRAAIADLIDGVASEYGRLDALVKCRAAPPARCRRRGPRPSPMGRPTVCR